MDPIYFLHYIFSIVNSFISVFGNSFLIYLIAKHTVSPLGGYKNLLTVLCVYNMIYSLAHTLISPGIHTEDFWFAVFCDGPLVNPFSYEARRSLVAIICSLFSGSVYVLCVHFVYRYKQMCRSHQMYLFNSPLGILFWSSLFASLIVFWYTTCMCGIYPTPHKLDVLRPSFQKYYNLSIDDIPFTGPLYRDTFPDGSSKIIWNDTLWMSALIGVMWIAFFTIIVTGRLTWKTISEMAMSEKTRRLQTQLFKSLVVLAILPTIFVYIPIAIMFEGPIIGFGLKNQGHWVQVFLTVPPAIDSLVIIYFIGDYRRAAIRIFKKLLRRKIENYTMKSSTGSSLQVASITFQ